MAFPYFIPAPGAKGFGFLLLIVWNQIVPIFLSASALLAIILIISTFAPTTIATTKILVINLTFFCLDGLGIVLLRSEASGTL